MIDVYELDSRISQFVVRSGHNAAKRKDLTGAGNAQAEGNKSVTASPEINLALEAFPSKQSIRIDVQLTYEDTRANYEILVSGQWISDEEDAFAELVEEDEDATLDELITTVLAPQIIPVAQAKILELSRSIDCPVVSFPYDINREIRNAQRKANPPVS